MTTKTLIAALNLPPTAQVDQRVPKKLLLENGAPTMADKRAINEGIEEIRWLAALKPATCGVAEFRDAARTYLEIAVLHIALRKCARTDRLIELVHRAVPYPVLLLIDDDGVTRISLAHKRHALNEADKVVLDGESVVAVMPPINSEIRNAFLQALDITRHPRATLYALYQSWLDTVFALQAATMTGVFNLLDSTEQAAARRAALHAVVELRNRIATLRSSATKATQIARQVELNLEIQRAQRALDVAARAL